MEPSPEQPAAGGLQRRAAAAARGGAAAAAGGRGQMPIHADVDPPPRPGPGMQKLAIAAILVLAGLQLLPATHFRHPRDPRRNWIPFGSTRSSTGGSEGMVEDDVGVDIITWSDCLDLRVLAVLANSTLSSSSDPESISFNFLIPEGDENNLYHKLKVALPNLNFTVTSQKEIKKKLNVATPVGNFLWSSLKELSPLIIATHFSSKRYVYISPDSIIKGKIEDIAGTDLGTYAIGAVEDCSKCFGDYVDIQDLDNRRRKVKISKPDRPYDKDACLLDFNVLLFEPRNLEKNVLESIVHWSRVLDVADARDRVRLAVSLAFYDKYLKLPSTWKRAASTGNAANDEDIVEMNVFTYDGPKKVSSEDGSCQQEPEHGNMWQQYATEKSIFD